jgi:hypothetical protein
MLTKSSESFTRRGKSRRSKMKSIISLHQQLAKVHCNVKQVQEKDLIDYNLLFLKCYKESTLLQSICVTLSFVAISVSEIPNNTTNIPIWSTQITKTAQQQCRQYHCHQPTSTFSPSTSTLTTRVFHQNSSTCTP